MVKIGPLQALCSRRAPYLDTLPLIQRVVEAYGADRCMWESDSGGPITMQDPMTDYPAAVALIRDHASFLSPAEKEAVLWGTAESFFFPGWGTAADGPVLPRRRACSPVYADPRWTGTPSSPRPPP